MIYSLGDKRFQASSDDFYVAPSAQVIGLVRLGHRSSVWFNVVLRADDDQIVIGDGSNVQDGTIIHVDAGFPARIGDHVSIGHRAIVHACTVGDGTLIANGAIVLDRAEIGRDCLIAAGSLVPPDAKIPDGSVIMGAPGKIVRRVSERDLAMMRHASEHYQVRAREYLRDLKADAARMARSSEPG